jgi:transcriptional regulator GlxA family with amidase domain
LTARSRICDIEAARICLSAAVPDALAGSKSSGGCETLPRSPQRFAFVLVPDFSMIAFASALEPLRIANRMAERELYSWQVVSQAAARCTLAMAAWSRPIRRSPMSWSGQGGTIRSSFCAAVSARSGCTTASCSPWLRRADRAGATIGAVGTGAHLLS